MFAQLISTLKKSPKTIVFTEGTDPAFSKRVPVCCPVTS